MRNIIADRTATVAASILADAVPSQERLRRYNANRARLSLPRAELATVRQFEEGTHCTGCTGRFERGVYVVHVKAGCPAHGSQL